LLILILEISRPGKYAAAFEDTGRYLAGPDESLLFRAITQVVKPDEPWHASMNEVLNGSISSMERLVIFVERP
jgi:hypothetical protein